MAKASYDFEGLEKKRREALSNQDAMAYSRLCNELGVIPEDEILYNMGVERREGYREVGIKIAKRISRKRALEKVAESLRFAFKEGGTPLENTYWVKECFQEHGVKVVEVDGKRIPVGKINHRELGLYAIQLMGLHRNV